MARKNYVDNATVSIDVKFSDSTTDYSKLNERFTVKKTSIMTHEQIANLFKFSKELIESKLNQLDMLPVVGYFVDGEATTHSPKAVPYGAILPNTARFEDIDGEEYLVADVCLWSSKYPDVADVSKNNQSMEIVDVKANFNKEEKCYEVLDYNMDCLTILGESVNPAFKKARMDVDANFSDEFEQFKTEFTEMLQNIKNGSEIVEGNKTTFTLIELGQIWDAVYNQLETRYPDSDGWGSIYRIEGLYEETSDNTKFVLIRQRESQELFRVDINITDDGITLAEEATLVVELLVETGEVTKFEEPENVEKYKEFTKAEPEVEPIAEPEPVVEPEPTVNYEELYNELQTKFNDIVSKYSELETEIVPLRQFKLDVETKENEVKAEMELKEKNDLIESFATKLPKKSIDNIIDDVTKFTLEEIKTKLSIELANQILTEGKDNAEFGDITVNIDNMNKSVSREERLIEEVKNIKNKLKK